MRSFVVAAVAVAAIAAATVLAYDHCGAYPSCPVCVADPLCGWCSENTTEQDGQPGPQCAGFNKDHNTTNFTCNGIFSTETCETGWECDTSNETCVVSPPGTGQTLAQCQANCSDVGKTFICDNATMQCVIAPAGQGTSLPVCQAACGATSALTQTSSNNTQTNSPASNSPQSNSPQSSSAPTTTAVPLFTCDVANETCVPAAAGQGTSLIVCQQQCQPSNVTPSSLIGLWRGFPISNGAAGPDEYDYDFKADNTVKYTHTPGTIVGGTVTSIADEITITFSDGTQQACLFRQQLTQPTTYEQMLACNTGSKAPTSFQSAMSNSTVLLLQRCVDPSTCTFKLDAGPTSGHAARHFPANSLFFGHAGEQKHHRGLMASSARRGAQNKLEKNVEHRHAIAGRNSKKNGGEHHNGAMMGGNSNKVGAHAKVTDNCMPYGANCTYCLAQPDCGWCSQDVTYSDGTVGTQCAGFAQSGHTAWKCDGQYSTDDCYVGWTCNATTQQCVLAPPGDGNPSKRSCEAGCHSKPGPPSQLLGKYRGIQIYRTYPAGVWKLELNESTFTETAPDGTAISGALKHYAQYLFVTIQGQQVGCIWSPNTNEFVEYFTFACGTPGGALPSGFTTSMDPTQGSESVFAKCVNSDCTW